MTVNSDVVVATAPAPAPAAPSTVLEEMGEVADPQVVEEEQIVMGGEMGGIPGLVADQVAMEGQVIMMTSASGDQQHVVITSSGGITPLTNGAQVIQVQSGLQEAAYLLDSANMKSEPEDLSFSHQPSIDLEAGAQAIQASAANAVQNVLRSLKESDHKPIPMMSMSPQLVPGHVLGDAVTASSPAARVQTITSDLLLPEDTARPDSGLGDTPEPVTNTGGGGGTPVRRSRSQADSSPRVQIAKQYSPFGFHNTLEAPTAQWVRRDEDRCTYLNKGQFYGVTLEYRPNPTEPFHGDMASVKSVVMLVFRDAKNPDDEVNAWEFWHQRQPTSKQRIIDAETNNMSEECGIQQIEDVSYNAIAVYWNPLQKPAFISIAVQCLSTDFSLQKGVKGLPLHLQVDTYVKNPADGEYDIVHRGYCQVKVFCDKGAERKFRQEERRASRKVAAAGQRVLEMYHQCQERSEFYSMVDLSRVPVLYTPSPNSHNGQNQNLFNGPVLGSNAVLKPNGPPSGEVGAVTAAGLAEVKRRKTTPPTDARMVVYVRQENEEIYTPLHLVPPTVPGLARAIESKYNVSASAIRYLYRRNKKGITAKLDDDLLKFYCNEDTFLMQVTAIELEGVEGNESIMYDITLCEIMD